MEDPFSPSRKLGDDPGTAVAPAAEAGIAPTSAPLGGAVGGDEGTAATDGSEEVSPADGNAETAGGGALIPSGKYVGATGTGDGGTVPGAPRTSAVNPASEAGIARKSASVSGPVGDVGGAGMPAIDGDFSTSEGCPESENISFAVNEGAEVKGETDWTSEMLDCPGTTALELGSGTDVKVAGLLSGKGLRGKAAKNSFASLAITARSGSDVIAANGFS